MALGTRELAFDRLGAGLPVVLMHGVGGRRGIWGERGSGTLQHLAAAGFEAFAVDLPGYAQDGGTAVGSIAEMAQAVHCWMQAMGLPSVAVVGHSMGAMVAQELAAQQPRHVQALVLACSSPAFGSPGGNWQEAFVRARLEPLEQGQTMARLAAQLVPTMLGPGASPQAAQTAMALMASVPSATYRAAIHALVGFDRRAALAQLQVPVLCVAGGVDRTAPPTVVRRMADRIALAQYALMPEAGHLAPLEQPQVFNDLVAGFLARSYRAQDAETRMESPHP